MELLFEVGLSLSSERDHDRLIEKILIEAKRFCRADGGTIYMVTEDDHLEFAIMRNDTMGTALEGTTGMPLDGMPRIPARTPIPASRTLATPAAYAANACQSVNVETPVRSTASTSPGQEFDRRNGYRSHSLLTIPMRNNVGRVIGMLQLINAQDEHGEEIVTSIRLSRRSMKNRLAGGRRARQPAISRLSGGCWKASSR